MSILAFFEHKSAAQEEADFRSQASLEYLKAIVELGNEFQLTVDNALLAHPQFRDHGWIDNLVDDILRMRSLRCERRYRRMLDEYHLDSLDVICRLNLADDLFYILGLMQECNALESAFLGVDVQLADLNHPRQVLGFYPSNYLSPEDQQLCYAVIKNYRATQGASFDNCRALHRKLAQLRDTIYDLICADCKEEMQNLWSGLRLECSPGSKYARICWIRRELDIMHEPYVDSLYFQALSLYCEYMGALHANLQRMSPAFAEYRQTIAMLKTKGPST